MKKILYLLFALIIFSCSSNEDSSEEIDNTDDVNPITDRYKIYFDALSGIGEKHFKAIYTIENEEPIVVDYDGFVTASGFVTANSIQNLKVQLEMKENGTYLYNFYIKIEDLHNNTILKEMHHDGYYILPTDLLTEKDFINDLYDYPPQNFSPKNNYKFNFSKTSNTYGTSISPNYDFRDDVLVHRQTRGSLRIVVDNASLTSSYDLDVPYGWSIRDYQIGNPLNNILSSDHTFANNIDKIYEFILPGHQNTVSIKLSGDDTQATIYLMRKDGTTETVNVHSVNNEQIITNFNI